METQNLPLTPVNSSSPQPEPTLTVDTDELYNIIHNDGSFANLLAEMQSWPSTAVNSTPAPQLEPTRHVYTDEPYNIIHSAFLTAFQETHTILTPPHSGEWARGHRSHKTEEEQAALRKLQLSKNNMAARAYRGRKKAYLRTLKENVALLEDQVKSLREERCILKGSSDAETANLIAIQESDTTSSPPLMAAQDSCPTPPIGDTDLRPPIGDTDLRELRLLKNKEAVRRSRQKKKEVFRHLQHRKVSLENQSKTLLEELQSLKAQVFNDLGTGGVPTMSLHSQKTPDASTAEDSLSLIFSHH